MVVDFAVHGKDRLRVFANQRLSTGIFRVVSEISFVLKVEVDGHTPTPTIASRSWTNTD